MNCAKEGIKSAVAQNECDKQKGEERERRVEKGQPWQIHLGTVSVMVTLPRTWPLGVV